jgi:hypothetical protein
MNHNLATCQKLPVFLAAIHSHGLTGGVYKTRERIHRSMLICDY